MTLLNNITILKPGMLAAIAFNAKWNSGYYWNVSQNRWNWIPESTPIMIIQVDSENIHFIHETSLFKIYNCYNDVEGYPYWCDPL